MSEPTPSADQWLREAKEDESAAQCGMYLIHNGVVRQTAKAAVREGKTDTQPVTGMYFDYDADRVAQAVAAAKTLPGIHYVRVWLNRGELAADDDIMLVLIGGDIRPRVVDALQSLVGELKQHCVSEREIYG